MTSLGYDTCMDLTILDMIDFYLIFGMDWLSPYNVFLYCQANIIDLVMMGVVSLEWKGTLNLYTKGIMLFLRSQQMIEKGCLSYLECIDNTSVSIALLELIQVITKAMDVFYFIFWVL